MAISRIDQPEKHNHGYYIRVTCNHHTQAKFFADKATGGKRTALRAAKEYEAELVKQAQAHRKNKKPTVSARNRSGIVGVARSVWNERGKPVAYWQAGWVGSKGERKSRKYSVNKHGEERARRLAIKARREGRKEREAEIAGSRQQRDAA